MPPRRQFAGGAELHDCRVWRSIHSAPSIHLPPEEDNNGGPPIYPNWGTPDTGDDASVCEIDRKSEATSCEQASWEAGRSVIYRFHVACARLGARDAINLQRRRSSSAGENTRRVRRLLRSARSASFVLQGIARRLPATCNEPRGRAGCPQSGFAPVPRGVNLQARSRCQLATAVPPRNAHTGPITVDSAFRSPTPLSTPTAF